MFKKDIFLEKMYKRKSNSNTVIFLNNKLIKRLVNISVNHTIVIITSSIKSEFLTRSQKIQVFFKNCIHHIYYIKKCIWQEHRFKILDPMQ